MSYVGTLNYIFPTSRNHIYYLNPFKGILGIEFDGSSIPSDEITIISEEMTHKIDWLTPQNEGEIEMLSILIKGLNHKDTDKTMKGV